MQEQCVETTAKRGREDTDGESSDKNCQRRVRPWSEDRMGLPENPYSCLSESTKQRAQRLRAMGISPTTPPRRYKGRARGSMKGAHVSSNEVGSNRRSEPCGRLRVNERERGYTQIAIAGRVRRGPGRVEMEVDHDTDGGDDEEVGSEEKVSARLAEAVNRLDQWHVAKKIASRTWHKSVGTETARGCIKEFQRYTIESNVVRTVCAVCAESISATESVLYSMDFDSHSFDILKDTTSDEVILDPCGMEAGQANVCRACDAALKKKQMPKFAIANGFDVPCPKRIPKCLQQLTLTEERLISCSRSFGLIVKVVGEGLSYLHSGSHQIVVPQRPERLPDILPHPILQAFDNIQVIWVGKSRPKESRLLRTLGVRKKVVMEALEWLCQHNKLYKNVRIDRNAMDGWGEHFVPAPIMAEMTVMAPDEEKDTRSNYAVNFEDLVSRDEVDRRELNSEDNMEKTSIDGQGTTECREENDAYYVDRGDNEEVFDIPASGFIHVDGYPEENGPELVNSIRKMVYSEEEAEGTEEVQSSSVPHISYKTGSALMSSYSDSAYYTGTFPALFWKGTAGHLDVRQRAVGLDAWGMHLLKHHNHQFSKHKAFLFVLFDDICRRKSAIGAAVVARRSNWTDIDEALKQLGHAELTEAYEQMKEGRWPSNKDIITLLKCLQSVGQLVPLSNAVRERMRSNLRGMIVRYGAPALWFTLNPSDLLNPLVCTIAGVNLPVGLTYAERKKIRMETALGDPVSAARFFKVVIDGVFQCLVKADRKQPGVFGDIETYFMTTETNGRGMLHGHGLMWIKGNTEFINLKESLVEDAAFAESVTSYMESIIKCSIELGSHSDRDAPEEVSEGSLDISEEGFKERYEYDSNKVARNRNMHTHTATCYKYIRGAKGCRFGAPWNLQEQTQINEDGIVMMKRNNAYVNNWNPALACCLRSNHDIAFILTRTAGMALIHYITDYATKLACPTYESAAIAAAVRDKEQNSNEHHGSRLFLQKTMNKIGVARELGAVEIANAILQQDEYYTPGRFSRINVNSLYIDMCNLFPELDTQKDASLDVSGTIGKYGAVTTSNDDYRYRGEQLKNLSLYDYRTVIYARYNAQRESGGIPYDREYAYSGDRTQSVYASEKSFRTVTFSGQGLSGSKRSEAADERCKALLLGIFVPWETLRNLYVQMDHCKSFTELHQEVLKTLSPRVRQHIDNVELMRRSARDAEIDRRNMRAGEEDADLRDLAEAVMEQTMEQAKEQHYSCSVLQDISRKAMDRILKAGYIASGAEFEGARMIRDVLRIDGLDCEDVAESGRNDVITSSKTKQWANWLKAQDLLVCQRRVGRDRTDGDEYSDHDDVEMEVLYGDENEDEIQANVQLNEADCGTGLWETTLEEVISEDTLNDKQAAALVLVMDALKRKITWDTEQEWKTLKLYLGGEGGTGKSRVISSIKKFLDKVKRKHVLSVTAMTGAAADNIGGSTVHSELGLVVNDKSEANRLKKKGVKERFNWRLKEILIVDEISMMKTSTLDEVDQRCRELKGNETSFGGLAAVVLCGDFYQFPPIGGKALWETEMEVTTASIPMERGKRLWRSFTEVIMLNQQMRQADDDVFHSLLLRARRGKMTMEDYGTIVSKRLCSIDLSANAEASTKVICASNSVRHRVNMAGVFEFAKKRSQRILLFLAEHKDIGNNDLVELYAYGDEDSVGSQGILPYTEGMPVVINRNLYTNLGVVNGKEGVAKRVYFQPGSKWIPLGPNVFVIDRPPGAMVVEICGYTEHDSIEGLASNELPIMPTAGGSLKSRKVFGTGPKPKRTQIPVSPAFAITDYKCQGRTFERVAIDFRNMGGGKQKQYAAVTVPLSRVKSLQGLSVMGPVPPEAILKRPDERLEIEMNRLRDAERQTMLKIDRMRFRTR